MRSIIMALSFIILAIESSEAAARPSRPRMQVAIECPICPHGAAPTNPNVAVHFGNHPIACSDGPISHFSPSACQVFQEDARIPCGCLTDGHLRGRTSVRWRNGTHNQSKSDAFAYWWHAEEQFSADDYVSEALHQTALPPVWEMSDNKLQNQA